MMLIYNIRHMIPALRGLLFLALVLGLVPLGAADPSAVGLSWSPANQPVLEMPATSPVVRHWARPAALAVLARSAQTVDLEVRGPKGTATAAVRLEAGGWRRLLFPVAALPGGTAEGGLWWRAPDGAAPVEFALREDPAWTDDGPGLSESQVLAALDPALPALEAVRRLRDRGATAEALQALARHFRARMAAQEAPASTAPEDPATVLAAAERVLRGEYTMLTLSHTYPGGVVDWHLDPTVDSGAQTNEWIWTMGRHESAARLAAAFRLTGEARFATAWADQVGSWMQAMPLPAVDWERPGSGWRFIEAGIRTGEFWTDHGWPLMCHPAVSDHDLLRMVRSVAEHGDFLMRRQDGVNNHFVMGMTGLYRIGSQFPELAASATWRRVAVERLERFITPRVGEDASWFERSPSYHLWIVQKVCLAFRDARLHGHEDDFSPAFHALVQRMAEWSVRMAAPDRIIPSLNDSTRDPLAMACAPEILAEFPASTILAWGADLAAGRETPAPLPPSGLLAGSGYAVMRTSWASDASYLVMDVGPMGGGHGHLDALNLLYAADGTTMVFDGTGGTYNATAFRPWSVSTASHNAVLVDGASQCRPKETPEDREGRLPAGTPAPVFQEVTGGVYAAGWHIGGFKRDGSIQVRHRREVLFSATTGVALVVDTLRPEDAASHRYDLRWQLQTTQWDRSRDGRSILPRRGDQRVMAVVPLTLAEVRADSGVMTPEILGWDVIKAKPSKPPVPALTVRHLRAGAGEQVFATLLVPGRQLEGHDPVVSAGPDGIRVSLGSAAVMQVEVGERLRLQVPGQATLEALRTPVP